VLIRCGLHVSECLMAGSQVSGLAVQIATRIASAARPSEILVSRSVKALAAQPGRRIPPIAICTC
jgi:class 3 adenylate cyclase